MWAVDIGSCPLAHASIVCAMQVFGPALVLDGFPPWLARQSEIYIMGRLSDAEPNCILRALQKYCNTSQRFGT